MRGFASLFGRRGVLAAAFAAATVLVVTFLVLFAGALFTQVSASDGLVFGWIDTAFRAAGRNVGSAAGWALYSSVTQGIALIPVTVLTGVLLWVWLQKHPHKHVVAGLIDEV